MLKGLPIVLAKYKAFEKQSEAATKRGLIKAGLQVERIAKKNAPVDTGNLKASGQTVTQESSVKVKMKKQETQGGAESRIRNVISKLKEFEVGVVFGASYAIFVHELHKTRNKFLEKAYKQIKPKILNIIKKEF